MERGFEITLTEDRSEVHRKIDSMSDGWRLTLKRPLRSLSQNDLMWARLTDVSEQVIWYGNRLTPTEWKDVFTGSLAKAKVVPSLDGDALIVLGLRTSEMEDAVMGALLELIEAFGAQNSVKWKATQWLREMAEKQRTAKPKSPPKAT